MTIGELMGQIEKIKELEEKIESIRANPLGWVNAENIIEEIEDQIRYIKSEVIE